MFESSFLTVATAGSHPPSSGVPLTSRRWLLQSVAHDRIGLTICQHALFMGSFSRQVLFTPPVNSVSIKINETPRTGCLGDLAGSRYLWSCFLPRSQPLANEEREQHVRLHLFRKPDFGGAAYWNRLGGAPECNHVTSCSTHFLQEPLSNVLPCHPFQQRLNAPTLAFGLKNVKLHHVWKDLIHRQRVIAAATEPAT